MGQSFLLASLLYVRPLIQTERMALNPHRRCIRKELYFHLADQKTESSEGLLVFPRLSKQ